MKKQSTSNLNRRGEGLVIVIILVVILGAGAWWLFSTKNQSDKEARAFGRQMIENLAVKHDLAFFSNNLGPQAKLDYPPSMQQMVVQKLTEMGTPVQPIKIDESVTFESQFFSPRGVFTAHLNYPSGPSLMQLAISHPVGKWQVDDLTITWKAAAQ
jgi:hypothetical protein